MKNKKYPLILVDGSSYLYRAFHALPSLNNSKGEPTGAIKGVISMLRRLVKDYPASSIVVVFDAKGKTFRSDIYPEYKAHRPPMPDELRLQIEPIHQIIKAMGLPLVCVDGVEADDVIGTLAWQSTRQSQDALISTGDKDMAQLVNDHVFLVNTMTDTWFDIQAVEEKYGVKPELIIDWLALMGDKSDNIPGVAGVGEKTALALLQGLGGLDAIYQDLNKVAELSIRGAKTLGDKLRVNKEDAYLSQDLATIRCDLDLALSKDDLTPRQEESQQLLELYQRFEFKTWTRELEERLSGNEASKIEAEPVVLETSYETILQKSDLDRWIKKLIEAEIFAFDTETTSLNYMEARVVGVSFAVVAGEAAYVPFGHDYMGAPEQLSEQTVLEALRPILESDKHKKVGQNLKYDMNVLKNHEITLRGVTEDTMLQSYVINSVAGRHDMDSLAQRHLDITTTSYEEVAGKGAKQLTFNQVALDLAAPYAAEDADITLRLHESMSQDLACESQLLEVYQGLEVPLIGVLSRLERNGALVDRGLLVQQSTELAQLMLALEKQAWQLADEEFNLNSPKQLQHILYEKQGIPVTKKTPKGQPSTAEPVLQELAHDHELPAIILQYRSLAKLKSTYTDKLPEQISPKTGRVHTSYHQGVTATGRLSSSDPNLQNIPIRTTEGRRIRQAFIADKGNKIMAADYSQIELRIMAHLSNDAGLTQAFAEGLDVHRATAAEVFSVDLKEVSDEQRRKAKAINFGLIYGMSAFGLARQIGVRRDEAAQYIEAYFARYPGVADYMERTRAEVKERGWVETLSGRRLYLPEINARNPMRRQGAERTAINAPMQGTAADIIKQAMIDIDCWLYSSKLKTRMIMQVHDELVFEVPEDEVPEVKETTRQLMEAAAQLNVPLLVDVGLGGNWDEAH